MDTTFLPSSMTAASGGTIAEQFGSMDTNNLNENNDVNEKMNGVAANNKCKTDGNVNIHITNNAFVDPYGLIASASTVAHSDNTICPAAGGEQPSPLPLPSPMTMTMTTKSKVTPFSGNNWTSPLNKYFNISRRQQYLPPRINMQSITLKPSTTDAASKATITVVVTNHNDSRRRLLFGATMASILLAVLVFVLIFSDGEFNGQSTNWKNRGEDSNDIFSDAEQSSTQSIDAEFRLKLKPASKMDFSHQV